MRKSNVWTNVIVIVFLSVFVLGCNKQDKMSILGTWRIDIKEVKGFGDEYEYAWETLRFDSGNDKPYSQTYEEKRPKQVKKNETTKGNIERKKGKITFKNRMRNEVDKQPDETFSYRLEDDKTKLILVVEGAGFPKNEKVYTKVSVSSGQ